MEGGAGDIDLTQMSLPLQLFSYLFRPLPFEARSLTSLAASLDNLILLFIFVLGGWKMLTMRDIKFSENRQFLWIFSISSWSILAVTTANLGISVRQKWMFTQMLIYLLNSVIGRKRKQSAPLPLTEASDTLLPPRNPTDSIHKT